MNRFVFSLTFFSILLYGSVEDINKKIDNNKKRIEQVIEDKNNLNKSLEILASEINKEEAKYNNIRKVLEDTSTKIALNILKLSSAKEQLSQLRTKAIELKIQKEKIEKDVIDYVIEKFAMTMGVEQAKKESLKDIVDKEVYSLILDNLKQEILELNIDYIKVNAKARDNEDKTVQLTKFIEEQEDIKKQYLKLQDNQLTVIDSLKIKHKQYQQHLKTIVDKQNQITDLLGSLNILKQKEIKKEKEERIKRELALKRQQEAERKKKEALEQEGKTKNIKIVSRKDLDDDIDIEVKKIGSSNKGIKISKYSGTKTIAPLKSYDVTKSFGKYYDKVYKMELFNESVSLKTKFPNAKVFSVFKGQVVYAKQNSGLLENVVIVKHSNNLHTIYSHLDQISPTLKVGKWIPKGYVVGRVNDTLVFQATKDSQYIDPEKLFK